MTFLKAMLKITTHLLVLLIAEYFVSLEASKLYRNTSHVNVVRCIEKERWALLKFKDDVVDPSGLLSSWSGPDCCTWKGVGCRYPTGEVVRLHLSEFSGVYSFDNSTSLGGKINNHLNELQHLSYLNLSHNDFSGMIPPQLGNLSNLLVLDLSEVGYATYVSDLNWISSLSSLKFLDLSFMNLSLAKTHWLQAINTIPSLEELHMSDCDLDTIPLSLSQTNLTSLSVLDLSANSFKTQAPHWISNLSTTLEVLALEYCDFTGPITNLFPYNYSYHKLEALSLFWNNFSGELPDSMEHLQSLRTLDLSRNSISGPIPTFIGMLSKLESLNLSFNNMNGYIPKSLGKLEELKSLYLYSNEWEGILSTDHFEYLSKLKELKISSSSGGLVLNLSCNWVPPFSLTDIEIQDCDLGPHFPKWLQAQTQLEVVVLQNVSISDTIPNWLWKLPRIVTLNLSGNKLRGSIPVNIGQMMSSIDLLDLSNNLLGGNIPFSLGKMSSLTRLDISNNHLSGKIHNQWTNKLEVINFSNNNLSGKLPSSLFSLPNLGELKLSNNSISGELPIQLTKSSTFLSLLDLGDNKLSGSISKWIEKGFTSLIELRMRGNMFNGSISEQYCRLQNLHVLDLAQNNLSGHIPSCLSKLSAMYSIDDVVPLPWLSMDLNLKGNKYTYGTDVLPLVTVIDLSGNNLSGFVPENITNLICLGTLNLSNNLLTGKIPSRIGDMQNLETLDLSSNHFIGQIPQSISSIASLSHLNLSHNKLSGPIPSGTQLSTFDESSYEGNSGLCGNPLPTKCVSHGVKEKGKIDLGEDNESKDGKLGLFVSIALGFIFGFWSICGTLVAKKSWRRTYFGVIDKTVDQFVVVVRVNLNRFYKKIAKEGTN